MITSWRIVAAEHADVAFTGEGALLFGGRWNSAGKAVIYTAQSAALAALELLVRTRRERPLRKYVLFACSFREDLLTGIEYPALPDDWRKDPPPPRLQELGDAWLIARSSAALRVPSAVIETEHNYLFNPEHPDFTKITIAEPTPFTLDVRLLRR